jgi:hypothetical protein
MSSILSVSVRNYDYSLHTIIHFTHVLSGAAGCLSPGITEKMHCLVGAHRLVLHVTKGQSQD